MFQKILETQNFSKFNATTPIYQFRIFYLNYQVQRIYVRYCLRYVFIPGRDVRINNRPTGYQNLHIIVYPTINLFGYRLKYLARQPAIKFTIRLFPDIQYLGQQAGYPVNLKAGLSLTHCSILHATAVQWYEVLECAQSARVGVRGAGDNL